jgi:hypothetical protein
VRDFGLALVGLVADPVFLIFGVIFALLVKQWKYFWAFPLLGMSGSAGLGMLGASDPPLMTSLAYAAGMSLVGLFALLGREFMGREFRK